MVEEQLRSEANRLYWETQTPVAEIADRLGISRRALYDAIDPQPAGSECPDCGGVLAFRNRTTAERTQAECLGCELEVDLAGLDGDAAEPEVEQERVAGRSSPVRHRPTTLSGSGAALGGAMLVGIALGATVGLLVRKR